VKKTPTVPVAVSGLVITGVLLIGKVTPLDVAPQGLTTVIEAVPAFAIREAGTVAVSCVEETNVVASADPFQFTVELETKFVPFTVNVNCGPPTAAQVGLSELIVGVALIVNVTAFDVAPQGLGFTTVIEAVPGFLMFVFGTVAVSWVAETNVVVSAFPFQLTVELARKFVPFTVNVNALPPAMAQVGLSELIEGVLHGVGVGVGVGVNVADGVGVGVNVAVGVGVNVAVAVGVGV
jgi:hypothetical protein